MRAHLRVASAPRRPGYHPGRADWWHARATSAWCRSPSRGDRALGRAPADRGGEGLLPRRGHRRGLRDPGRHAGRDRHRRGLGRRAGRLRRRAAVRGPGPLPAFAAQAALLRASASGRGGDLAEHGLGQGDGPRRPAGSRHDAGLAVHPGRHPPPGRHRAPRDHHDRHRAATATSCSACSRSAATSSRPGTPTSPTPSCGGSTPRCWTASSPGTPGRQRVGRLQRAAACGGCRCRRSCSTGTTWCGSPGRWPPARSAPTT